MTSLRTDKAQVSKIVLMLACGAWPLSKPANGADDQPGLVHIVVPPRNSGATSPPGAGSNPGFQGFGLGYHLGNGYGGKGLGVGAGGGYPFYGGPGYLHDNPPLRRLRSIVPFPYYGGPGRPSPGHPYFYADVGPLAVDPPVITIVGEQAGSGDFGPATGAVPYPDTVFAPFTAEAAGTASEATRIQPGLAPRVVPPGAR